MIAADSPTECLFDQTSPQKTIEGVAEVSRRHYVSGPGSHTNFPLMQSFGKYGNITELQVVHTE